jgi:hypothetical protein
MSELDRRLAAAAGFIEVCHCCKRALVEFGRAP